MSERMPQLETRTCGTCGSPFRCYQGSERTDCTRCERRAAKQRRDARFRAAMDKIKTETGGELTSNDIAPPAN